ncbi:hypothetical protein [Bacillus sp. Bos-x628]|uniref:DUF7678 domain-containing protein n=1 Tax=Bacillus maqinnsis TaxID=3229854 RepID=UPI00338E6933
MELKFIKRDGVYVSGFVNNGEYHFDAKLFDKGSLYGINKGRVSLLTVSIGDKWTGLENCILNYDRGWDVKPQKDEHIKVFTEIVNFLENSPTNELF